MIIYNYCEYTLIIVIISVLKINENRPTKKHLQTYAHSVSPDQRVHARPSKGSETLIFTENTKLHVALRSDCQHMSKGAFSGDAALK